MNVRAIAWRYALPAFLHMVGADVRQEGALERIGQAEVDVVVARLEADRGLGRQAGE